MGAASLAREAAQGSGSRLPENSNQQIGEIVGRAVGKVKRVVRRVSDLRVREYLKTTVELTERVAEQSQERLAGGKPTERVVSLVDPGARPIVKGKLDKPVEFGRLGQIVQDESGYFTQYGVYHGNPNETGLLPEILKTHQRQFPKALKAVAADTGYASQDNYDLLRDSGVTRIGIPWRGKPPPSIRAKHKRLWYKALRAFRAGIEGSLSFLSRQFRLKRSLFRGDMGTQIWVGWTVIAANLYRYGRSP